MVPAFFVEGASVSGSLWVMAALALLVLELVVPAFVFCWFGAAALIVALASYLGLVGLAAQLALFAGGSTALVLSSRAVFHRFLLRGSPGAAIRTNAAALPGES